MVDILTKEVSMPFDEAVERVRKLAEEQKFNVMLVKSIDEVIRTKLGLEIYPRYTVIMACAPDLAKMALDISKNAGLLFPCTFVVYEDEGKIFVGHASIMKMACGRTTS